VIYPVILILIIIGCKNEATQSQPVPAPEVVIQAPPKTLVEKNKETIEIALDCDRKIHTNQTNMIDKLKNDKFTNGLIKESGEQGLGFMSQWMLTESGITKVEMGSSEIIQSWAQHPDNEGVMSKAQKFLADRKARFQQGLEMLDTVMIPKAKNFIEQDIQNGKSAQPFLKLIVELQPYIKEGYKNNVMILEESINRMEQVK